MEETEVHRLHMLLKEEDISRKRCTLTIGVLFTDPRRPLSTRQPKCWTLKVCSS